MNHAFHQIIHCADKRTQSSDLAKSLLPRVFHRWICGQFGCTSFNQMNETVVDFVYLPLKIKTIFYLFYIYSYHNTGDDVGQIWKIIGIEQNWIRVVGLTQDFYQTQWNPVFVEDDYIVLDSSIRQHCFEHYFKNFEI